MPKPAGHPAARLGDAVAEGIIIQGEESVLIGGAAKPVACKECKAREIQNQGYPVNTSSGAKILPDETDFSLPSPRTFAWQRFYASDTPFVGLLGQGWHTVAEIRLHTDAQRSRLIDQQGRWIDFAALAPGEEQHSPSEGLWLARSSSAPEHPWARHWQWLPASIRQTPGKLLATTGDGDYFIFSPADPPTASGAPAHTRPADEAPDPPRHGHWELITLIDRNGYATHLRWQSLTNAEGQACRCPEFIEDSAHRLYRLHYRILPDEQRAQWAQHPGHSADGQPLTDPGVRLLTIRLAWDPASDTPAPHSLEQLRARPDGPPLVSYRYSPAGDLAEVLDRHGRSTARFHWQHHLLTRQQRPGSAIDDGPGDKPGDGPDDGLDITYRYDSNTPAARVTRQTQRDGLTLDFHYREHETIVTDSLGRRTHYHFSGTGGLKRLTRLTRPDGSEQRMEYTIDGQMRTLTDPLGRSTHYRHSLLGEYLGSTDPLGQRQSLGRDPRSGLVSSIIDTEGQSTRLQRDARGNPTSSTAPDGRQHKIRYGHPQHPDRPSEIIDAKGGHKHLTWTPLGQIASHTDCSGQKTTWHYDREGRLETITDAAGQSLRYRRDAQGRVRHVRHPDGREEHYDYDAAHRLIRLTDPQGKQLTLKHDRFGRLIEQHSGQSRLHYRYDPAGRLIELTNAGGASMHFGWDALDRLIEETGFDGQRTTWRYNQAGEVIARRQGEDSPEAQEITYQHDPLGRLIARHLPACEGSPAQTHRFTRDKAGRLTRASTHDSCVELSYNAAGLLARETQSTADGFSQTLHYEYDPLGNRSRLTLADGQSQDTLLYGSGHWHQLAWNGEALIDVERDKLHRETLRHLARCGGAGPGTGGGPLTRRQSYTPAGQLAARSLHTGQGAAPGAAILAGSLAGSPVDSLAGSPVDSLVSPLIETAHYHYDGSGLLTGIDQQQALLGQQIRYAYDAEERLAGWQLRQAPPAIGGAAEHPGRTPDTAIRHQARYAHDAAGNPRDLPDARDGELPETPQSREDRENREKRKTPEAAWEAQVLAGWRQPAFNVLGGPCPANRIESHNGVRLTYDGRGNVIVRQNQTGTWHYAWNALNQMTASRYTPAGQDTGAWGAGYFYDAFGRRIGRQLIELCGSSAVPGKETGEFSEAGQSNEPDPSAIRQRLIRSLWDGDRLLQEILPPWRTIAEQRQRSEQGAAQPATAGHATPHPLPSLDLGGALYKTCLYEPGSFIPVAQIVERKTQEGQWAAEEERPATARIQHLLGDHLGTPTRMIDARSHETLWARTQDPWGNTLEETVSPALDADEIPTLRFQGQQWDWETGLHYNRFRYYDPMVRRYLSEDPIGLAGGMNLYGYVGGNPVSYTDPRGLDRQATGPAIVTTDMSGGKTVFYDPQNPSSYTEIPTSNAVTRAAHARKADTPYHGQVTVCQRGRLGAPYGTAKLRTTDPRSRWVHGGGSGLPDPYASQQGWKPTEGCTRAQNEDVEDLCDKVEDYQQSHPGASIPYGRF